MDEEGKNGSGRGRKRAMRAFVTVKGNRAVQARSQLIAGRSYPLLPSPFSLHLPSTTGPCTSKPLILEGATAGVTKYAAWCSRALRLSIFSLSLQPIHHLLPLISQDPVYHALGASRLEPVDGSLANHANHRA